MNPNKNKKILKILFYFLFLIVNIEAKSESILLKDLTESTQCFNLQKMNINENGELIFELINNNFDKTLFIQYKSIESIYIYKSKIDDSNIIFSRKKGDNNFINNYYFDIENNVNKYFIIIEFNKLEIYGYKICFNLFENKGNSFKSISGNSLKISSYEIINSGKFPFYLKDDLSSFTAIRINKKCLKFFNISNIYINNILNSEEQIEFNINKFFNNDEYQYIFWNLDINKSQKLKEIFIEVSIDIIKYDEINNKFELELVNNFEIHYEYKLNIFYYDNCPKIYYINLQKYIIEQDMDILCFTNIFSNDIYISNSYNINNENSINIDKRFFILNKYFFEKENYKNSKINHSLLFLIIDEKYKYNTLNIVYHFILAGSSHEIYQYHDEISKKDIFKNNKLVLNSNKCSSFYIINYFIDSDEEYIMEYEPIIGKVNISFSNSIDIANDISEYLKKLDSYPVQDIKNSVIQGDFGIFKINCIPNSQKVLSYLNIYKKNFINDVIYFNNQKAFIYLQKDQIHSFTFDSELLNEKFSFKIRIWKKDAGKFNIEIKYNNYVYDTLKEDNFLELKHEKNENPIIYISIKQSPDNKNKDSQIVILELIKDINIDKNMIDIQKTNIYNTNLQSNKILFAEYTRKDSTQIKLTLKNEENDKNNICLHIGYGIYPYLIKPECSEEEIISLIKGESINIEFENPFNNNEMNDINSDNHFYVSLYSDKNIKYDYVYEKYSVFNVYNQYKNIDFNGREIIQLNNSQNYKNLYYQINLCQDFNSSIQTDIFKPPLFNYYFETKNNLIIIHDIKSDIIKGIKIPNDSSKQNIIFTKDEILAAKFKYIFSPIITDFIYNDNYSKKLKIDQTDNKLTINLESPFIGDVIINIIFITSDFDKYNSICNVIDLLDEIKNEDIIKNYNKKLIKKEINSENNNDYLDIDIKREEISELNKKEVKIYIVNSLKEINLDVFYEPLSLKINLGEHLTELENEQNTKKIQIIIIVILVVLFIIFIIYRNRKRNKYANNINFDKKQIQLDDINESNKLF